MGGGSAPPRTRFVGRGSVFMVTRDCVGHGETRMIPWPKNAVLPGRGWCAKLLRKKRPPDGRNVDRPLEHLPLHKPARRAAGAPSDRRWSRAGRRGGSRDCSRSIVSNSAQIRSRKVRQSPRSLLLVVELDLRPCYGSAQRIGDGRECRPPRQIFKKRVPAVCVDIANRRAAASCTLAGQSALSEQNRDVRRDRTRPHQADDAHRA